MHIGAAYKMYRDYHAMLKDCLAEPCESSQLQALQECSNAFDKIQPLLADALHTALPSQLQQRPLQAQRAVLEALHDLAATCTITAWDRAHELASQVQLSMHLKARCLCHLSHWLHA